MILSEFQNLSEAGIKATNAAREFKMVVLSDAERQYKDMLGTVPGSYKTKRLRKKRIKALSYFF